MTSPSTAAADGDGGGAKATDLWVNVNGVATRVLCWGRPIDENAAGPGRLVLCVCGNPGVTEFYERFLQEVYRALNVPVWVVSHAGHEIPPSNSELKIPDPKKFPDLYTLKGQVEHKLQFIEKYVPDNCDLYFVGHSIGSKIISELLKDSAMRSRLSVKRSVFLFPTLQKMRETPNGRKLIFTTSYLLSITIFLSWIFTTFPSSLKTFLVKMFLITMEGGFVEDHVIRSAVRLIHPMVLRNVFSMAVDEMDKVYDLDSKANSGFGMSSDNEPTWSLCKKAVWMLIQNSDNLADAEELLNRPEDPDLHVACGKCFILLLVVILYFYII